MDALTEDIQAHIPLSLVSGFAMVPAWWCGRTGETTTNRSTQNRTRPSRDRIVQALPRI